MPISGLVLKQNATGCTVTAGTDITFTNDGVEVKGGKHVADVAEANFVIRKSITVRNRNPTLKSDGTYTKAKRILTLVHPKVLANQSIAFNVARIEFEMHPEMTTAEVKNLRFVAAQLCFDPDLSNFLTVGSIE